MIKINDYIFPEENILYIRQQTERTVTVLRKRPNEYDRFKDEIEIKATFDDIEWNYGNKKRTQEHTIKKGVCDKNKKLLLTIEDIQLYIQELEEENERLKAQLELEEDNRHFLNNKIDKAIEYIEEKWYEKNTMDIYSVVSTGDIRIDILKILKGEE